MFTGIIEEVGRVEAVSPAGMSVRAGAVLEGVRHGDSIAVNGACLTVTRIREANAFRQDGDAPVLGAGAFSVDIVPETWRRTSLGALKPGDPVNLERSLGATGRLGGHFVQGHVDGVGRITAMEPEGDAVNVRFQAAPELARYIVEKGFIAVEGISLTVVRSGEDHFSVTIIPYTREHTNFQALRPGSPVNLEVDILAKYVERFMQVRTGGR